MKLTALLLTITFIFGCTDQDTFLIKVEQDWVFVDNKKVANTADIAEQDSLWVDSLYKALVNRKVTSKDCQIKIEPEQRYDIANTCRVSGYTNLSIVSKTNGEDEVLPFFLNCTKYNEYRYCENEEKEESRYPYLSIVFYDDSLYLTASGGTVYLGANRDILGIFYKENLDSACEKLVSSLTMIQEGFFKDYTGINKDSTGINVVDIAGSYHDMKVSYIIPLMHKLKAAGPTKINLRPVYKPPKPIDWSKYHLLKKVH